MISDLFATMAVGVGHDDDEPSRNCPCVPRCPLTRPHWINGKPPINTECRRRRMPGDGPSKDCLCGQGRCSVDNDAVFPGRKIFLCYNDDKYGQLATDSTDSNGFSHAPCHFHQFVDASPEEVQTSVRNWAARSRWCERRGHFIDGLMKRLPGEAPRVFHPRPCAPELQTGDRRCTYLDDAYVEWGYRPTVDYLVECPCLRPRCTGLTRPHGDPDYDAYFNAKKDVHGWVCDHGDVCPVQVKVPRCNLFTCTGPIVYDIYRRTYIPRRQCHDSSHNPDVVVRGVQPCTAPDTEHLERHWRSMREAEAEAAKAATVQTATPAAAATMRASDEMQQTTIGGDSDVDGSDQPRRKTRRRVRPINRLPTAARRERAAQAAAAAAGDIGAGEATRHDEVTRRDDDGDSNCDQR